MLNMFSGVLHPTHKRKAAQRKRKARSIKRKIYEKQRHSVYQSVQLSRLALE